MIPDAGPKFEKMIGEIDSELIAKGMPIPSRPLNAVIEIGKRFKISLPLVSLPSNAPSELKRYAQLSENIHTWYEKIYGDRLKIDFSSGSMILDIDGDLYVIKIPRIWGTVEFTVSCQFTKTEKFFSRGPVNCNILQLIENLTPAKAEALPNSSLEKIYENFVIGLEAHSILEANQNDTLIQIARGDIKTAMNYLMDRADRYGESKWASLQATEKTLKAAIALESAAFKPSHNLTVLCTQLNDLGVKIDWQALVGQIQCSPGIRYGEQSCSRNEALEAHHASLKFVAALVHAGAKLQRGQVCLYS